MAITNVLADAFAWLRDSVAKETQELLIKTEDVMNYGLMVTLWEDPMVVACLNIARTLSMLLVAATLVVVIFDIAEEVSGHAIIDWGRVVSNFIKGLSFAYLAPSIGKVIMQTATSMATVFRHNLAEIDPSKALTMAIIYLVGHVVFTLTAMMRIGSMFVLCLTSPFYVPDIVRGETKAIGEWGRQVIALGFTYLFQYLLFHLGASYIETATRLEVRDGFQLLIGFSLWMAMTQVPKLLSKFGMSSGTAGVVTSATQTVGSAARVFIR